MGINPEAHKDYCVQAEKIGAMYADIQILKKITVGNGTDGLVKTVPRLAQLVETLNKNVETNNTLTSGVLKFKAELDGIETGKAKMITKLESNRVRNRWMIGVLVGVILALIGWLIVSNVN